MFPESYAVLFRVKSVSKLVYIIPNNFHINIENMLYNIINNLPNITIPLYEIEVAGLKIPITLSYHASGIKFADYDGDIGAGWSIDASGYRISRTLLGGADEKTDILPEDSLRFLHTGVINWRPGTGKDFKEFCEEIIQALSDLDHQEGLNAYMKNRLLDREYDQFKYFLPSTQGSFIISDRNRREISIAEQNLDKIILDPGKNDMLLEDIEITDDKGFIYYFGGKQTGGLELAERDNSGGKNRTAWALSKILSPLDNRTIATFEYTKKTVFLKQDGFMNYYVLPDQEAFPNPQPPIQGGFGGNDCNGGRKLDRYADWFHYDLGSTLPYLYGTGDCLFTSKIYTDYVDIEFVRFNIITGYYADYQRLKEIIIKNKSGRTIRTIKFNYTKEEPYDHTLLESVVIMNDNQSESEKYKFEYYLPEPGTSFIADQWGYYKSETGIDPYYRGIAPAFIHEEAKNDKYLFCYAHVTNQSPIQYLRNIGDDVNWAFFNRTKNEFPHYFSLKKIIYPTGGSTTYEYEPNQYPGIDKGGGQRIAKITSDPQDGITPPVTTMFKYGWNESGIGINNFDLNYNMFKNVSLVYDIIGGYDVWGLPAQYLTATIIRTYSSYDLTGLNQFFSVKYPEVTTYQVSKDQYTGKVKSSYDIYEQYVIGEMTRPIYASHFQFPAIYDTEHKDYGIKEYRPGYKPLLMLRLFFNDKNNCIKTEEYAYKEVYPSKRRFLGLKQRKNIDITNFSMIFPTPTAPAPWHDLYYLGILHTIHSTMLSEVVLGTHVPNYKFESLVEPSRDDIESYEILTLDERNRVKKSIKNWELVKEYSYPEPGSSLDKKNIVSTPVETITQMKEQEIGRIKYEYAGNSILPNAIKTSASGANDLRTDLTYDLYDKRGNLLQYTHLQNFTTSYIWGYNYLYPIAEIKGASFADVKNALGNYSDAQMEALSANANPSDSDINSIDTKLRTYFTNKPVLITTYAYKPLYGMSFMINEQGVKTTFEYDGFGRLIETTYDGKKVDSYQYNYRK